MYTKCVNPECGQKYRIKSAMLGQTARCKKCNTVFLIKEHQPPYQTIELDDDAGDSAYGHHQNRSRVRLSPEAEMQESIAAIKSTVVDFLPRLNAALRNQADKRETRLLVEKMLSDILGYGREDIRKNQAVAGHRADYVASVDDRDVLVVEAKKIGVALMGRQIGKASACAAHAGTQWVVLTNAMVWQLFHVATTGPVRCRRVFTIDLKDGLDDREAMNFYLISKNGLSEKGLERAWQKISVLCYDNVVEAILTDDVITRIRTKLAEASGCALKDEEVRRTIEENIFQLS